MGAGSSGNNCVLKGGLVQVLALAALPLAVGVPAPVAIHNVVFQGLTFTGALTDFDFPGFGPSSVIISAPGRGISFKDCHWRDLSNASVIMSLNRVGVFVPPKLLPPGSTSVTIKDSSFTNIVYTGTAVFVNEQDLIIETSSFREIDFGGPDDQGAYVLQAVNGARLSLVDSCFNGDVSFAIPSEQKRSFLWTASSVEQILC